ncbi:hypothetical protein ABT369_38645 [Dactylosporangium sp. NPDC000244]|uniref:hypothetical protein n=1 Tax=Dactylosporangium sp. NPDC000244 TaxID=3154365 RepID=UPI0033189805
MADLTPEARERVLADVQRRREIAADLRKTLPQETFEERILRQHRERQARLAEAAGQLDLGDR